MIYSKKLKELREINKLTQKEIAQLLNIKRGVYSIYETEEKIMPIKHLDNISINYNISIDYLFNLTNVKTYENSRPINIDKSVNRLKEFRKENKLTQIELAKFLNVANGTIANYENGRNFIATPFLFTLCSKYKISADYLLGKIDSPKNL